MKTINQTIKKILRVITISCFISVFTGMFNEIVAQSQIEIPINSVPQSNSVSTNSSAVDRIYVNWEGGHWHNRIAWIQNLHYNSDQDDTSIKNNGIGFYISNGSNSMTNSDDGRELMSINRFGTFRIGIPFDWANKGTGDEYVDGMSGFKNFRIGNFADIDKLGRTGDTPAIYADDVLQIAQRLEIWGGGAGKQYLDIRDQEGIQQIKFDAEGESHFNKSLKINSTLKVNGAAGYFYASNSPTNSISNYIRLGHGGSHSFIDSQGVGNLHFRYNNPLCIMI